MGEAATPTVTLDTVIDQALQLSALEGDIASMKGRPLLSARGILAHLGPAPSAEDIDEARREAWANFPREDIA